MKRWTNGEQHLDALPAYQLREELEALKRSFYIFNTNATELASHVGRFLASTKLSQQLSDNYVKRARLTTTQLPDFG